MSISRIHLSKAQRRTLCDLFDPHNTNTPVKPFIVQRLIEKGLVVVTDKNGEPFYPYRLTEVGKEVFDKVSLIG